MSNRFRTMSLWSGLGPSETTITDLPSGDGVGWRIQKNQVDEPVWYRPFSNRRRPDPSGLTRIRFGVSRSYQVREPRPPFGNLPRPSTIRMKYTYWPSGENAGIESIPPSV